MLVSCPGRGHLGPLHTVWAEHAVGLGQRRRGPGCKGVHAPLRVLLNTCLPGERDCSLTAPHPEEAIVSQQKIKASVKTAFYAKLGPTLPGEAFPGGHLFTVIPQPGLKSQPCERELLQLRLDPTVSGRRAFQVGAQVIHSVAGRTNPET